MLKFITLLVVTCLAHTAAAHEPYLVLTAEPDATLTVEAGFSDGSDVEGLKVSIRDRSSGEELGTRVLPSNGIVRIEIPTTPYRVVFDGGPGHKVSKPGPSRPLVASAVSPAARELTNPAELRPAEGANDSSRNREGRLSISTKSTGDVWLIVSVVFLLASVCFLLGFLAGRSGVERK